MQQKALIVMTRPGRTHGLDELNIALQRGWRVARVAPMGGAGTGANVDTAEVYFAALVVIERTDQFDAELMEQAEEVPEEAIDALIDGDGANGDVANGDVTNGDGANGDVEGL